MGSVLVSGRDTKEVRGERRLDAGSNQLEADVRQSFFQQLLDRLQDLADVRIEEEKGEIEMNTERLVYDEGEEETDHHLNSLDVAPDGYQLIYRDDALDDYRDYYSIPYVYYTDEDYTDMLEDEQFRLEESWQAPEAPAASPIDLLHLPGDARSSYARGRALALEVAEDGVDESVEEVSAAVSVGVSRPNVASTPTDEVEKEALEEVARMGGDTEEEEEEIPAEVLIDRSKVELLTL